MAGGDSPSPRSPSGAHLCVAPTGFAIVTRVRRHSSASLELYSKTSLGAITDDVIINRFFFTPLKGGALKNVTDLWIVEKNVRVRRIFAEQLLIPVILKQYLK